MKTHIQDIKTSTSKEYDRIVREFEEFKKKNDLNNYFAKNLDETTRIKLLKEIEDLLKTEPGIKDYIDQ